MSNVFVLPKQTLMGIFYYMHSVALIEDLPLEHTYADPKVFFVEADKAYSQVFCLKKFSEFIAVNSTMSREMLSQMC